MHMPSCTAQATARKAGSGPLGFGSSAGRFALPGQQSSGSQGSMKQCSGTVGAGSHGAASLARRGPSRLGFGSSGSRFAGVNREASSAGDATAHRTSVRGGMGSGTGSGTDSGMGRGTGTGTDTGTGAGTGTGTGCGGTGTGTGTGCGGTGVGNASGSVGCSRSAAPCGGRVNAPASKAANAPGAVDAGVGLHVRAGHSVGAESTDVAANACDRPTSVAQPLSSASAALQGTFDSSLAGPPHSPLQRTSLPCCYSGLGALYGPTAQTSLAARVVARPTIGLGSSESTHDSQLRLSRGSSRPATRDQSRPGTRDESRPEADDLASSHLRPVSPPREAFSADTLPVTSSPVLERRRIATAATTHHHLSRERAPKFAPLLPVDRVVDTRDEPVDRWLDEARSRRGEIRFWTGSGADSGQQPPRVYEAPKPARVAPAYPLAPLQSPRRDTLSPRAPTAGEMIPALMDIGHSSLAPQLARSPPAPPAPAPPGPWPPPRRSSAPARASAQHRPPFFDHVLSDNDGNSWPRPQRGDGTQTAAIAPRAAAVAAPRVTAAQPRRTHRRASTSPPARQPLNMRRPLSVRFSSPARAADADSPLMALAEQPSPSQPDSQLSQQQQASRSERGGGTSSPRDANQHHNQSHNASPGVTLGPMLSPMQRLAHADLQTPAGRFDEAAQRWVIDQPHVRRGNVAGPAANRGRGAPRYVTREMRTRGTVGMSGASRTLKDAFLALGPEADVADADGKY